MLKLSRRVFLISAAMAMLGCAATSHVVVGTTRPAIAVDQVKVYLHPPAKFEEVAILEGDSRNSWSLTDQGKMDHVINLLKAEAAKLGANGVLLTAAGDKAGDTIVAGGGSVWTASTWTNKAAKAVAIFVPSE